MKTSSIFTLLLLAAALTQNSAHAEEYDKILLNQSSLAFTFRQMNVPAEGRFKTFDGEMRFDPTRPEQTKTRVDIDLAEIDAGSDEANDALAEPEWLDTRQYPEAQFVATAVRPLEGNRYEFAGQLTIKGHTRAVTAVAGFQTEDGLGVLDGDLTIKRADFSIGEGPWADFSTVANEILVHFRFVLSPKNRN
jgi:polyisoprenoid-binding protein YceI